MDETQVAIAGASVRRGHKNCMHAMATVSKGSACERRVRGQHCFPCGMHIPSLHATATRQIRRKEKGADLRGDLRGDLDVIKLVVHVLGAADLDEDGARAGVVAALQQRVGGLGQEDAAQGQNDGWDDCQRQGEAPATVARHVLRACSSTADLLACSH